MDNDGFDERQEVIERKEGYYWNVSVQLGKASERVKAKAGGNETRKGHAMNAVANYLGELPKEVKEAHDKLTEEE